jgi:hypothetical protein
MSGQFSRHAPFGVFRFSSKESPCKKQHDALRTNLGPAFQGPNQDAITYAMAMALGVRRVQRAGAAAQKDPAQVTAMIDQLERDWKLYPGPLDSMNVRREALIAAQASSIGALASAIRLGLDAILGDLFVEWRSMDLDAEVSAFPAGNPVIPPATTAMKWLEIMSIVWPGTGVPVGFRGTKGNEVPLKIGDILTVAPGLFGIEEVVTVTAVQYSWTNAGTFTANFAHVHEIGERATTAPWPDWGSNKRAGLVVVTDLTLMTPTLMARVHTFMRKIMPAVSAWTIVEQDPADHSKVLSFAVGTQPIGWSPLAEGGSLPVSGVGIVATPTPLAAWYLPESTSTPSTVAQLHEWDIDAWTRGGIGTVTTGVTGPITGSTAVQLMQDTSTGAHGIDMGWSGTATADTSIVFDVVAKIIGAGVYIWVRDAWDSVPLVSTNGVTISVVAGVNCSAWIVPMPDYGSGWFRFRVIAKGLFHTPVDPDYAASILMGDVSGYASIVGNTGKGIVIHRVQAYQLSELTAVPNTGSVSATLVANGTYPPEFRDAPALALSRPDMWAPTGANGLASTVNASVLALYGAAAVSTTAVNFAAYQLPTAAYSTMVSRSDGASFSFGLETTQKLWLGIYGAQVTSADVFPSGYHNLAVVKSGATATAYVDGELFLGPVTITNGTPNIFTLAVSHDSAINEARVFSSALTAMQARDVAVNMLPGSVTTFGGTFHLWNGSLWDTRSTERLSDSDSVFTLPGGDSAFDLTYYDNFGAPASGASLGPTVLADGVVVATIVLTGTAGLHTETIAIPSSTTSIIVRNSPRGSITDHAYGTTATFSGGAVRPTATAPAHRLVIVGDSVANGWNSTIPGTQGWAVQLKNARANGRVTIYGWGGYAFANEAAITGWLANFSTRIASLCDGTVSNDIVFGLCINDAMGGGWSGGGGSAGYAAAVGALLDAIHALVPAAHIWLWGPHTCTNTLGSAEATVGPYRTAELGEVTGRTSYCTAIDASAWTVAMDNTDATHLHPNTSGHATLYSNMRTALSWT